MNAILYTCHVIFKHMAGTVNSEKNNYSTLSFFFLLFYIFLLFILESFGKLRFDNITPKHAF